MWCFGRSPANVVVENGLPPSFRLLLSAFLENSEWVGRCQSSARAGGVETKATKSGGERISAHHLRERSPPFPFPLRPSFAFLPESPFRRAERAFLPEGFLRGRRLPHRARSNGLGSGFESRILRRIIENEGRSVLTSEGAATAGGSAARIESDAVDAVPWTTCTRSTVRELAWSGESRRRRRVDDTSSGGGRLGHFVDTTRGEGGRRRGDDGDAPELARESS